LIITALLADDKRNVHARTPVLQAWNTAVNVLIGTRISYQPITATRYATGHTHALETAPEICSQYMA